MSCKCPILYHTVHHAEGSVMVLLVKVVFLVPSRLIKKNMYMYKLIGNVPAGRSIRDDTKQRRAHRQPRLQLQATAAALAASLRALSSRPFEQETFAER